MYLNDHSRSAFYGALGLNTTQFNRHVIIETNNATARVFPEVRPLPPTRLLLRGAWPGLAGADPACRRPGVGWRAAC